MDWVTLDVIQALWRTDVVSESTDWCLMPSHVVVLPFSKEADDEVASELSSENLGEEVNILDESSLKNDWDVGGVEQLDWVWLSEASHLSAAQAEFNSEALEVDDNEDDNDGGDEIHKVWCVLSIEGLLNTVESAWLGQSEVEESNDGTFEFSSLISSNGDWGEAFPEDHLTNVGGDEERDT